MKPLLLLVAPIALVAAWDTRLNPWRTSVQPLGLRLCNSLLLSATSARSGAVWCVSVNFLNIVRPLAEGRGTGIGTHDRLIRLALCDCVLYYLA